MPYSGEERGKVASRCTPDLHPYQVIASFPAEHAAKFDSACVATLSMHMSFPARLSATTSLLTCLNCCVLWSRLCCRDTGNLRPPRPAQAMMFLKARHKQVLHKTMHLLGHLLTGAFPAAQSPLHGLQLSLQPKLQAVPAAPHKSTSHLPWRKRCVPAQSLALTAAAICAAHLITWYACASVHEHQYQPEHLCTEILV